MTPDASPKNWYIFFEGSRNINCKKWRSEASRVQENLIVEKKSKMSFFKFDMGRIDIFDQKKVLFRKFQGQIFKFLKIW